jgi:DNA-directed RNA polymerase subunit RPC12/RpoP
MSEHEQRDTDAPFGPEEADAILALVHAGSPLTCPRCAGRLVSGTPTRRSASMFTVFSIRCPTCRRAVFAGEYLKPRP